MRGLYEADLGAGLCKKRIAVTGQGKRGSTRTLVAKESVHGILFIVGRQKSDAGTDFTNTQVDAVNVIGMALQRADQHALDTLMGEGVLKEICHESH